MRARFVSILVLLIASKAVGAVSCGYPFPPPMSTVPSCIVACPAGDAHHFVVIVRDACGGPLSQVDVLVSFEACPTAFICPSETGHDPYTYIPAIRSVFMKTNANGVADFPLRVGGTCGPNKVTILAGGTYFGQLSLASPDQDGDGVVSAATDAALLAAKFGGNDSTADLDCDGDVDTDDLQVLSAHVFHTCSGGPTSARQSTWGKVKAFYR